MAVQLYAHNMQAYQAVQAVLARHGKAAVIHPTGTGKSFIAFRWIEDTPGKRFLWLSPSDYIVKTQLDNVKRCAPDFPVERVSFITYAKLMQLSEAEMLVLAPDCIILDEFHRCGAEFWGQGVQRLLKLFPQAQLLGLSATKVRYLDNQRDMAEELFEGCIASEITLGESIVRGILPTPKYVTTLFRYQSEIDRYQKRVDNLQADAIRHVNQQYLDELRRALEQADGLDAVFQRHITDKTGKYLIYCASRNHMLEMKKHATEWFGQVDAEPHCYLAYSDDPETSRAYKSFVADDSEHLKLLFSINMFNEGIHVPGVSGVILFRPTVSPIIYKQQIGRALTAGTVRTPLILDIVNNFDGLHSYGNIQQEMDQAVEQLRQENGAHEIVTERFEVIEQLHDCVALFQKLEDSLSSTWEYYYKSAEAYYAGHGDLKVPRGYTDERGLQLGLWVYRQRANQATLTAGQAERLNALGMVWEDRAELAWQAGYEHAVQYYQRHGHLRVPEAYQADDGYALGYWLHYIRSLGQKRRKSRMLTPERRQQLEALGICWNLYDDKWEASYRIAAAYYEKHGHLRVPGDDKTEKGSALRCWINVQRQAYKGQFGRKPLTEEQIRQLEAIGMVWDTQRELGWANHYAAAKQYFEQNGNMRVPYKYVTPEGIRLGAWVNSQRKAWQGRANKQSNERYRMLERIGVFS